jgi:DNA-binding FadR family transcriptional regulator
MPEIDLDSDLLEYIIQAGFAPGDRLPTINELQSDEHLGISISKVREQLEVARALGLVEVKSKTGMKMRSYSFTPAVRLSLFFALAQDQRNFELFGEVRNHMEVAFWNEACARLEDEDKRVMRDCLDKAHAKLNGKPVRIPTEEHRTFHLTVFKRLDNPFVMGILEAYWDAYNAVELNRYSDYSYLQQVWSYHERIFEAICNGDYERAKSLFIDHTNLIRFQPWMQRIHAATDLRDGNE